MVFLTDTDTTCVVPGSADPLLNKLSLTTPPPSIAGEFAMTVIAQAGN